MKRVLFVAAAVQMTTVLRPLVCALAFHRLPAELRDGAAARRSVEAAIAQDTGA
jgi:hypothetical protein